MSTTRITRDMTTADLSADQTTLTERGVLVLLLMILAFVVLYRDTIDGSDFDIVPDATEYAVGAANLASGNGYTIVVEGKVQPPRYSPWFSTLWLAPAFAFGQDLGYALVPITIAGVLVAVIAFLIGSRIGMAGGGILATLGILALPMFSFWGRRVMTDVPTLLLILASLYLFILQRASWGPRRWTYYSAMAINTLAMLFRPVAGALFIPWTILALTERPLKHRMVGIAVPLAAVAVVLGANSFYNVQTFGEVGRSGFHYWCGVPYDYPELIFSWSNLKQNLPRLIDTRIIELAAAATVFIALHVKLAFRDNAAHRALMSTLRFTLLVAPPMVVFHLLYYMPRPRYFMPAIVLVLILGAASAGRFLRRFPFLGAVTVLISLIFFTTAWRATSRESIPSRRLAADEIANVTPEGAIVITGQPVSYVEYVANRDGRRRIIPLSRRDEYASKVLTPKRVENPDPAPMGPVDHRCEGLLRGGASEAVDMVAMDRLDELVADVRRGVPLYIDISMFGRPDDSELWKPLRDRFTFEPSGDWLYRLK